MLSIVMEEMVETTTRSDFAFRRESLKEELRLGESTNPLAGMRMENRKSC